MKSLLDIHEASEILKVKVATLRAWCHQGRIPFVRVSGRLVRFRESDLERWLDAQAIESNGRGH